MINRPHSERLFSAIIVEGERLADEARVEEKIRVHRGGTARMVKFALLTGSLVFVTGACNPTISYNHSDAWYADISVDIYLRDVSADADAWHSNIGTDVILDAWHPDVAVDTGAVNDASDDASSDASSDAADAQAADAAD